MADLAALPAVEAGYKVWEKVRVALADASPCVQSQFRDLKAHLSQVKRNPDLRFTPLVAATIATADDGQGVGIGAAKIYGVYLKKTATATDTFVSIVDEGTDANYYGGALTGSVIFQVALVLASQKVVFVDPDGLTAAVGIRVVATTAAAAGTTASAAADAPNGFIVSGAA